MLKKLLSSFFLFLFSISLIEGAGDTKYPNLTEASLKQKVGEMMAAHVSQKTFNRKIAARSLRNFVEFIDPAKTYWILEEVQDWIKPSDALLDRVIAQYKKGDFTVYEKIYDQIAQAIKRRRQIEEGFSGDVESSKKWKGRDFRKLDWAQDQGELKERLQEIYALRMEALNKLDSEEKRRLTIRRLEKHRKSMESDYQERNPKRKKKIVLSYVIKSIAGALDTHTAYFTPAEASQFLIGVQKRLFGIGVQLRDDVDGFSVVKVLDGGPAAKGNELKARDRIIEVDGEPVVGMDIFDAVQLIRGDAGTVVVLRIVRKDEESQEQTFDIEVERGEVILTENRYETTLEPFGNGVIARIKLYSFYKDPNYSSAGDVLNEIRKAQKDHHLEGIILDLRSNSGGILSEAVHVCGLFISKGIVVSVKNDLGQVQHLRDVDGKVAWDGPLLVLTNRASASAAEIVAQTLQDYGRALVVGDDHTFGKGSFQTFSLDARNPGVNPQGEYKVTRGKYYTVSGKTPQKVGVRSDIILPGVLSKMEIGENFAKFPLENDTIPASFEDDLEDLSWAQKLRFRQLYQFNLQKPIEKYREHLTTLAKNSERRVAENTNYQNFLKELDKEDLDEEDEEFFGQNDLQLLETYNIMKDLIFLLNLDQEEEQVAGF